ncbi:High mobility group B protein [Vigna angularis]|uniref:High mobility group B protein n=1 Tax=Phaseolus angularis TaxID=3914 RepID=A0A8T0LCL7_PHAAN|nr:High mobility group B protein [Vigna angularis]
MNRYRYSQLVEARQQEKVQYYDVATDKRAEFDRAMAEYNKKIESGEFDETDEESEFDE